MSKIEHITELANTIALQADALTGMQPTDSSYYAKVLLLANNLDTLKTWTAHLNPNRPKPEHTVAEQAVAAVEASGYQPGNISALLPPLDTPDLTIIQHARDNYADAGYCTGCGRTFRGAAGLRSHQSQKFNTLACQRQR